MFGTVLSQPLAAFGGICKIMWYQQAALYYLINETYFT